MTMYRIQKDENRLQPFRSDKFSDKYLEKELEDWFEANSIVLTDVEPSLVIGRQVNTEGGGTIDLLGENAEGAILVVECLGAALWAFHRTDDFRSGVLVAVNLGDDADTTGAVFGQIAGAYYGEDGIPNEWKSLLAKRELIMDLSDKLFRLAYTSKENENTINL